MLTVTRQLHLIKCQASFRAPCTQVTRSSKSSAVVLWVVRHIEWLVPGVLLESLLPIPRHVLDGQQRPVRWQQKVKVPRSNDGVIGVLNDGLKHVVLGRSERDIINAKICSRAKIEYVLVCALHPICANRGVDGGLNVCAIEENLDTRRDLRGLATQA